MYSFQTWATSDFVPKEGQLVVFLALTGQMSHNHICFGKYNPSVHSRASPDPVRSRITDRPGISNANKNDGEHGRTKENPKNYDLLILIYGLLRT